MEDEIYPLILGISSVKNANVIITQVIFTRKTHFSTPFDLMKNVLWIVSMMLPMKSIQVGTVATT